MSEELKIMDEYDYQIVYEIIEKMDCSESVAWRILAIVRRVDKAEAMKWLKHFYKLQEEGDWSDVEIEAIEYFIQHFLNLTEEDLK
jgi:hypothetical protein